MPWQPDDWLLLRPIATDPEVVRYISGGNPGPRSASANGRRGRSLILEIRILHVGTLR